MRRRDARIEIVVDARAVVFARGRRFERPIAPFRLTFPRR
jgi:hypothetical protein